MPAKAQSDDPFVLTTQQAAAIRASVVYAVREREEYADHCRAMPDGELKQEADDLARAIMDGRKGAAIGGKRLTPGELLQYRRESVEIGIVMRERARRRQMFDPLGSSTMGQP